MNRIELATAKIAVDTLLDEAMTIARRHLPDAGEALVVAVFERLCVEYDLGEPTANSAPTSPRLMVVRDTVDS